MIFTETIFTFCQKGKLKKFNKIFDNLINIFIKHYEKKIKLLFI